MAQRSNEMLGGDRSEQQAVAPPQWSDRGYTKSSAAPAAMGKAKAAALAQTIEGEVIPRLMMALKSGNAPIATLPLFVPTFEHVRELAQSLIGPADAASLQYVEKLRVRGMGLESIYLDLLAPAALHLNHLWIEDLCDFTDVTIGLGRLHRIVRKLSPSFRVSGADLRDCDLSPARFEQRRAILAPVAGEQHTFGCVMVEDFFTRAGWEVTGWPHTGENAVVDAVRSNYYDLVGLSVSCEHHLAMVERQIKAIRRASQNRAVVVMVGGRVFNDDPKLVRAVGANMTGATGREAVAAADAALTRLIEKA
jgi:MerR family transcriptional regulator, light-induced transcriptional regulator